MTKSQIMKEQIKFTIDAARKSGRPQLARDLERLLLDLKTEDARRKARRSSLLPMHHNDVVDRLLQPTTTSLQPVRIGKLSAPPKHARISATPSLD